jgi:fatty-acyl-CoA synthase
MQPSIRLDRSLRDRLLRRRWGRTAAIAYGPAAIHHPAGAAIIDERGSLSFAEVLRRTDSLARGLRAAGVAAGDRVAIACRNHRGFIEATVACSKLAANLVYLDPGSAPAGLERMVGRENLRALIYDEECSELAREAGTRGGRFIAWRDSDDESLDPHLDDLLAGSAETALDPSAQRAHAVTLAGTGDGPGSGAVRELPSSLAIRAASATSRIPLRPRGITMIAAPMFDMWGFLHLTLGLRLASTLVLSRRFDPEDTLRAVERHCVGALVLLPEMLERLMELPETTVERYRTHSLRVIAIRDPALPSELAIPAMERFGDVLYSLRGPIVVQLDGYWRSARSRQTAEEGGAV